MTEVDSDIRRHCEQGDFRGAADVTLRRYGPEILGFMCARIGDEADGREAFSDFALDLWRGLAGFEWRCSARVWAYALAHRATHRYLRQRQRRRRRVEVLGQVEVPQSTRTGTPTFLRTPVRDGVRNLRDGLPDEERALLILRVDKAMTWRDIAVVLADTNDDTSLEREAGRLRKRFQLTKEKLRRMATRAGLLARHTREPLA